MEHADVPAVAAWFDSVDDLAMFTANTALPPSAASLARSWAPVIDGVEPRTSWFFVVEDPRGDLVAFAGIEDVNLAHGTAILPLFVRREARRSGLGLVTRAVVLDLVFVGLGLHRVISMHRADNRASRRMNEACGLRPEGTLHEARRVGQARVDVSVYGILADEWFDFRAKLAGSLSPALTLRVGDDEDSEWPTSALG